MTLLVPFAALTAFVLASLALSFYTLFSAKAHVHGAASSEQASRSECEASLQAMQSSLEGLAAQVHDMQQQPPTTFVTANTKPGLNLSKRSHALRLHRRGDPPQQIAAALEIPLQEVDLLIKVHRIVMSNI